MHARLRANRLNAKDLFQLQSVPTMHAHGWAAEDVPPPVERGKENLEKPQLLPDMGHKFVDGEREPWHKPFQEL